MQDGEHVTQNSGTCQCTGVPSCFRNDCREPVKMRPSHCVTIMRTKRDDASVGMTRAFKRTRSWQTSMSLLAVEQIQERGWILFFKRLSC